MMSERRLTQITPLSRLSSVLPKQYGALLQFARDVMDAPSDLTRVEKEQIGLLVSTLNGSRYCMVEQKQVLQRHGVEEKHIEALLSSSLDGFEDKQQALFTYIMQLTLGMEWISQRDIEAVYSAGWSGEAVKDAVCIASLFAQLNGLSTGLGLDQDVTFETESLDEKVQKEASVVKLATAKHEAA